MNTRVSLLVAFVVTAPARAQTLGVHALRVEYLTTPLGIDERLPRFSWQLTSTERATVQGAYELQVARDEHDLTASRSLLWDSGRTTSDASSFVDYAGPATASRTRYYWRVRVWDTHGRASQWSATSWWETGLDAGDWAAQWVGPPPAPSANDSVMSPAPMLRSGF